MTANTLVNEVSDAAFENDVLGSDIPVLVDFWAPWCGPCRMVAPVVDEVATKFEGQVKVLKLNVDDNPKSASDYGVRSIPTLLIFKDGKLADTVVGAVPASTLSTTLEKYLD
ncbi:MAG: thioredoxin [Leptolyngbya sp. SIO3F4]|nr:thioredoxin [Leptolyngbya sp. SIO3F4]